MRDRAYERAQPGVYCKAHDAPLSTTRAPTKRGEGHYVSPEAFEAQRN
ncbi:MAG TPA: hypothetical protein VGR35_17570 [Tepidisphaeraceae bacterium]|nr:hypothetical protein [Tepidisphaeraceae bacterium]